MNHLVFVVLDSARFDHTEKARMPWLRRLGKIQRRYSYASWTSPSHFSYLMGQLPHESPKRTFASKAYEKDLVLWKDRLGIPGLRFQAFLPELSLPQVLRSHGYRTEAIVSMPVLNPRTSMSRFFDSYRMMERHNDFDGMIRKLDFSGGAPRFYFLNVGEAHYPYHVPGEKAQGPRLHGLHGTFKHLDDRLGTGEERFFSRKELSAMKKKQIACLEYVDGLLEKLYSRCPANTHLIITSDHGELFGEDGYFGHGPIFHEKVFEVPLIEGRVPH